MTPHPERLAIADGGEFRIFGRCDDTVTCSVCRPCRSPERQRRIECSPVVASILDEIVAHKRREVEAARSVRPAKLLEELLPQAPPPRDFCGALRQVQRTFAAASGYDPM